jgi:N-methylhydantoinase B
MGLRRDIRTIYDGFLTTRSEGHKTEPWGIYGGKNGAPGKILLNPETPKEISIPAKKGNISLRAGDVVSIRTPGAGGFGDPAERSSELVMKDIREEVISVTKAERDYSNAKRH